MTLQQELENQAESIVTRVAEENKGLALVVHDALTGLIDTAVANQVCVEPAPVVGVASVDTMGMMLAQQLKPSHDALDRIANYLQGLGSELETRRKQRKERKPRAPKRRDTKRDTKTRTVTRRGQRKLKTRSR